MIQLQKPLPLVNKILGQQPFQEKKSYRVLTFCLYLPVEKGMLFFNNLTKELFLLTQEEFDSLNKKESSPLFYSLIEKWFFVPVEQDDLLLCEQIRTLGRLLDSKKAITHFNILPTTACNARCFYCFEAGTKPVTMTKKVAQDVANYIIKKCEAHKVQLVWFGGEPTCNILAIDTICNILKENNIAYSSTMVSNAYLFDKNMVEQAYDLWHLEMVQITLDGMEETYNRVKNYVNHDPDAFNRVLNNIDLLCRQGIRVQLRMNMGRHNAEELHDLITLLQERFGQYKNFIPYVNIIYEDVGYEKTKYSVTERAELSKQHKNLYDYLHSLGFRNRAANFENVKITSCQADGKDWAMILPDGRLGFCEHYVDGETYGTIYDDPEKPIWSGYKKTEEKCKICAAYPSCLILEKCPAGNHECYAHNQYSRLENLYSGMRMAYEAYFKKCDYSENDISDC